MYKENLFNLIRHEDVIIWAGAGLSIYAGFPAGKQLGNILYENLSKPEKEQINAGLLLPDLTEEIFRIKGHSKNYLIKSLIRLYLDQQPKSTSTHDKIAKIPHFKTIITTNYDRLFEIAYKTNYKLAYSSNHIPYLEKGKVEIFKIHGDLSEPNSIILTKSDYYNFFKNDIGNQVYWDVIKERIATKSVLFLGYNLEDPNISVIFERITDTLKGNRKECFLVSPNLQQHKINDLIKKDIQYINSTAEELIDELLNNLNDNISSDLEKGIISADTFRTFLANIGLSPEIKGNIDSYKLKSISGINGNIEGKINFSVKNDKDFIDEFQAFATGKKFGDFEIPEDKLIDLQMRLAGLKVPFPDEIGKIQFQTAPRITTKVDFVFDDGFEYCDALVKIFSSPHRFEIHLDLKSGLLIASIESKDISDAKFNLNYEHNGTYTKTKDEIELFLFLKNIGAGKSFTVYTNTGTNHQLKLNPEPKVVNEANYFLNYFEMLKEIEQHFNIRFKDINYNSILESYDLAFKVSSLVKYGNLTLVYKGEMIGIKADDSQETLQQLLKIHESDEPLVIEEDEEEIIELLGHKINLGYKTSQLLNPYIVNLDSIKNSNKKEVVFKSKTNSLVVSFSKTNRF